MYGKRYPSINNKGLVLLTSTDFIGGEIANFIGDEMSLYVLAGINSNRDSSSKGKGKSSSSSSSSLSSFPYDRPLSKGIETIKLAFNEPADIASLLYRIKEISRDLDRSLTAIVVNQLHLYHHHHQQQEDFGIEQFESVYKSHIKGIIRTIDMGTDLMHSTNTTTATGMTEQRGRLIFLACKEMTTFYRGCGSLCLTSSLLQDIGKQIRADHDIAVSTIHITCSKSSVSHACEKKSVRHALMSSRPSASYYC